MDNTLVFDLHGIIYSYDKGLSYDNSIKQYNKIITSQNPRSGSDKLALEFDSISKAIENHQNQLDVFQLPNAVEKLLFHIRNNDKIIIISNSNTQTQKLILIKFLKDKKLINNIDFYNSTLFGSKSDTETWHHILKNEKYKNITAVYEDTKEYLDAAQYAVKQLGHTNCIFSQKI